MKTMYRYLRPQVFDNQLCEIIPASKGGIAFRFDLSDEQPTVLFYTVARCSNKDRFNFKNAHNIIDGRMYVDRYVNSVQLTYDNVSDDLITIVYDDLCLNVAYPIALELRNHMKSIITRNERLNNRILYMVRNLSDRIINQFKIEADDDGRFYVDTTKL